MNLNGNHFPQLFAAVRVVKQTLDDYCLAPNKIPVSQDDIQYAFEQTYGVKIKTFLVPMTSGVLRGKIDLLKGQSSIYLDSAMNSQWTRYVWTKEICHHLVCDKDYRTQDPTAIIEFIVQDGVNTQRDAPNDVATEELTKFAALELLFPFELRKDAKDRIQNGEDSLFTVSEWLNIPEHIVELALADWYLDYTSDLWKKLEVDLG